MKQIPFKLIQILVPVGIVLLCVLISMPYAATRKTEYEAQARVWIQAQIPSVSGGDQRDGSGIYMPFMSFFNSPLLTAAEIIKSSEVVNGASALMMERFGKKIPAGDIAFSLSSTPIKDTDILLVKFGNPKPQVAADTLQAVLDSFVKVSSTQSSASATKGRAFLEAELAKAKAELVEVTAKLASFQAEHSVSNMEKDVAALVDSSSTLRDLVKQDQIGISKTRTAIALLLREKQNAPGDEENAMKDAMQKKLGDEQVRLAKVREQLAQDHPYVQRLQESIDNTRSTLKGAKGATSAVPTQFFEQALLDERRKLSQLEVEYSGHTKNLAALDARMQRLPVEQIQYAELTRRKELSSALVDSLERRLQSASLLETVSAGTTNIKVIDKPEVPTLPSGPSKALTMGIAAVIGVILAVAAFIALKQFNPVIDSVAQVIAIVPWTLAGVLGLSDKAKPAQVEAVRRAIKRGIGTRKKIVVVGSGDNEGKSQLASSLAMVFAAAGSRVVLVDACNRKGNLHTRFNVSHDQGLSDYVQSPTTVNPLKKVADNLVLLTTGDHKVSFNLFEQPLVHALLADLESKSDLMIFDTSAIFEDPEAFSLLEQNAFGVLTVRLNQTTKAALASMWRQLTEIKDLTGTVVITDASDEDLGIMPLQSLNAATGTTVVSKAAAVEESQPVW